MRVHLVAGRGALVKRVAAVLPLIIALCALIVPSTSAASSSHSKSHRAAHAKTKGKAKGKAKKHKKAKKSPKKAKTHKTGTTASLKSHGQLLKLNPFQLNATDSSNWFGYSQGTLEQGDTLFNSVSGNWTVPTATQHTSGQSEASSDWIGIGGGCVDSGCDVTDSTLIQTGTEQDVSSSGTPSYSAWYELVPAPSLTISMTVDPGDQMHASIAEVVPDANVWTITIQDLTRNESYTTTVPYTSTHDTAEWIEETPLEIGTDAGFADLPNLTNPAFSDATTNGAAVKLSPSEEMDLTDSSGAVIGAPSAPNDGGQGFDDCAWASSCS